MFEVEIEDNDRKIKIKADNSLMSDNDRIKLVVSLCEDLRRDIGLDSVTLNRDNINPNKYIYKWIFGAREWKQKVTFVEDSEYLLTFNEVVGEWKQSEIIGQRNLRNNLVPFAKDYKLELFSYIKL